MQVIVLCFLDVDDVVKDKSDSTFGGLTVLIRLLNGAIALTPPGNAYECIKTSDETWT